jgi:hypothetical protein
MQVTSTDAQLRYLRITIAVGYLCGIVFSPKLWLGFGRSFPRAPLLTGLPGFASSTDYLLSILLIGALALSLISSRPNRYLLAVVVFTVLLVLLDQTRLQPWVYQYVVMLGILACWRPATSDRINAERILLASQLVIALLYFWSGTQKLNWSFCHEVMPALLESARIRLPAAYLAYVPASGIAIAILEMLVGVGLLIRRTRSTALVLALGTHLMVLLMLIVAHRNSVVWPWNIAMMIIVVLLFWRFDGSPARKELWTVRGVELTSHLPKAVLLICGLAPALSFIGWWDLYLSAALYSGNTPVAVVRVNEDLRGRLPARAQQQLLTTASGDLFLPFYEWSLADLNVPPYPEVRTYRRVAGQVCALAADGQGFELVIKERPALIDGKYTVTRVLCADLPARP